MQQYKTDYEFFNILRLRDAAEKKIDIVQKYDFHKLKS